MKILDFYNEYIEKNIEDRDEFFNKNVTIKQYVPYLEKSTIAKNLANVIMCDKETGNIKIDSVT